MRAYIYMFRKCNDAFTIEMSFDRPKETRCVWHPPTPGTYIVYHRSIWDMDYIKFNRKWVRVTASGHPISTRSLPIIVAWKRSDLDEVRRALLIASVGTEWRREIYDGIRWRKLSRAGWMLPRVVLPSIENTPTWKPIDTNDVVAFFFERVTSSDTDRVYNNISVRNYIGNVTKTTFAEDYAHSRGSRDGRIFWKKITDAHDRRRTRNVEPYLSIVSDMDNWRCSHFDQKSREWKHWGAAHTKWLDMLFVFENFDRKIDAWLNRSSV